MEIEPSREEIFKEHLITYWERSIDENYDAINDKARWKP